MPSTSSSRLLGIDFAYAFAIFGVVIYTFTFTIGDKVQSTLTLTRFNVFLDFLPALFFFLNGFTVTLTMRDRRVSNRKLLSYLGKRGSVLFLVGLSVCVFWPMNIFIASGLMYIVAPFVAQWNNILLRVITLLTLVIGVSLLAVDVPTYTVYSAPTLEGGEIYNILGFILFNGYFAVLPWIAFFLAGLLFGRAEIRPKGWLPPSSLLGLALIAGSYIVNYYAKKMDTDAINYPQSDFFLLNVRLLFPSFIIYGIGACIIFTNACIFFFRKVENRFVLRFVQTLSSMKYSVLLFHMLIGLLTLGASNTPFYSKKFILLIYVSIATATTIYLTLMWRKRVSEQGPMEWLIKRISGSAKK